MKWISTDFQVDDYLHELPIKAFPGMGHVLEKLITYVAHDFYCLLLFSFSEYCLSLIGEICS